jgi:hypothetical protein
MVFVAIEPAEPPVGPVNQWASHLTGSLTGPVFETMLLAPIYRWPGLEDRVGSDTDYNIDIR